MQSNYSPNHSNPLPIVRKAFGRKKMLKNTQQAEMSNPFAYSDQPSTGVTSVTDSQKIKNSKGMKSLLNPPVDDKRDASEVYEIQPVKKSKGRGPSLLNKLLARIQEVDCKLMHSCVIMYFQQGSQWELFQKISLDPAFKLCNTYAYGMFLTFDQTTERVLISRHSKQDVIRLLHMQGKMTLTNKQKQLGYDQLQYFVTLCQQHGDKVDVSTAYENLDSFYQSLIALSDFSNKHLLSNFRDQLYQSAVNNQKIQAQHGQISRLRDSLLVFGSNNEHAFQLTYIRMYELVITLKFLTAWVTQPLARLHMLD